MDFTMKLKTYSGVENYTLPDEKIGSLEAELLKHYDKRIADLIYLLLDEECTAEGINSREKLFELEYSRNTAIANGEPIYGYSATWEEGAQLTVDQIKNRFCYIWKEYLFWESTGMDFLTIQLFHKLERIEDPDELLFWSFRFCSWGQYDNRLPYTLFRCIVDGRFERFYDSYPEWHNEFLCMDNADSLSMITADTKVSQVDLNSNRTSANEEESEV